MTRKQWNSIDVLTMADVLCDRTYGAVCVPNEIERTELFLSNLNVYARKLLLLMMKDV